MIYLVSGIGENSKTVIHSIFSSSHSDDSSARELNAALGLLDDSFRC